ncbi:MAG: hypothetical protein ABI419_03820 [Ginsengibacter sp.]
MEQIIIKIKDKKKIPFLKQLLKQMDFIEVVDSSAKKRKSRKKEILDGIEESVEQVKLHLEGKIKLRPLHELLDEL